MLSIVDRLSIAFDIRQRERKLVLLLLLRSFFLGVVQTLAVTTAATLFLDKFSVQELPYVYIGAAFIAPVAGIAHYKLSQRMSYTMGAATSLAILFIVMYSFFSAKQIMPDSRILPLAFYVWIFVQDTFLYNEFWALIDRAFNVRQAKRLSGLVATGDMIARIITGLMISMMIEIFGGVLNLLIPAFIAILTSLGLMIYISSTWQLNQLPVQIKKVQRHDVDSYIQLLKNRYVVLIIIMAVITIIVFYFVDITFIYEIRARFTQQADLAIFLGRFEAFISLMTLFSGLFLARPIIARYGVAGGLITLPVISGIGAALIYSMASHNISAFLVFLMVALTKLLFNSIRSTMHNPTYRVLIYPLLQGEKDRTHTIIEVVIEPAIGGIVGFILLRTAFNINFFSSVILFLVLIWIMVILFIIRLYAKALKRALGLRNLGGIELSLKNIDVRMVIKEGLTSEHAGEVIYMLDLMEAVGEKNESTLIGLLKHPAWEVRREVLRRIEQQEITGVLKNVRIFMRDEKKAEVRGAYLRVLSSLGGGEFIEEVQEIVMRGGWYEKEEAIIGQLRSGEIEGILWGGKELLKLEKSVIVEERIHAARIIGNAGITNFFRPLERLMEDDDKQVRREAVIAAGKIKNSHLWEVMIKKLGDEAVREVVVSGLSKGGDDVIKLIESVLFEGRIGHGDVKLLLRVCGKVKGDRAVTLLKRYMGNEDTEIAHQALIGLRKCGYRAPYQEIVQVKGMIREESRKSTWTLGMIVDIEGEEKAAILCRGLEQKLSIYRENIITLLMFLYDSNSLSNAWKILIHDRWSKERKVYALETIDAILPPENKSMILPLIEDIPYSECLRKLMPLFPQKRYQVLQRIQEVFLGSSQDYSIWLKACALRVMADLSPDIFEYHWNSLQSKVNNSKFEKLKNMYYHIDKITLLKKVNMFSEVPDEVLADIAKGAQEMTFRRGEKIFNKGDIGDSMYIILEGKLQVYDLDRIIAVRGKWEIIGEMLLLDPKPRSATVTAVQETKVLKLDHNTFFDFLAERVEVTHAIIKLLTQKIRELSD